MGTRNLTAVFSDGEYKVAQYGQWDGYPEGQGRKALEFIKSVNLDKFRNILKEVVFMDDKKVEAIGENWKLTHPQLSRDTGADILKLVINGKTELINKISFAGDSLFCEYAYVIDLDKCTFEIFKGFNKNKILKGRFKSNDKSLEHTDDYEPIKLWKKYKLSNLPTVNQFLKDLKED